MNVLENPRAMLQLEWRLLRLPYTIFEAIKVRNEHPQTRQEEARIAFLEDFIGRARGFAGFVMGDDDMIARGQTERAKAALRLEAITLESIVELRERAADQKLREERDFAEQGRLLATELQASRTARALADASKSKAQTAARAADQRGAARSITDAHRAALDEAEGRLDWEGVKAMVKEAVGSAIGSEKLIAAGELQQAQAEAHKDAATRQEDADRLRDQAAERFAAQEQALIDERARTSEEEAHRLAEVAREKQLQLQEQRAAQEREGAGRQVAGQRSAADEARAIAADLDTIVKDSNNRSSKEEI